MSDPQNILIIRFSSLGDIILASPLIRVLREKFPAAHIDFLTKSEYTDAVRFNPHLSTVIELKTSGFRELKTLGMRLRYERYDLILDIHNSLRSKYLRRKIKPKKSTVVNKRALRRFFLVHTKWNFYRRITPVAERYIETARTFGVTDDKKGLEIFLPDQTVASTQSAMSRLSLGRYEQVIGFVPTARHFTKRWPSDRFVEFGIQLSSRRHVKILIFGGKEDREYCNDLAQMINSRSGSAAAESFAGRFSLLETAAAFDFCHVVVSNDSGLMHLAAARKRSIVGIFGSTVREFGFFPYGTESIVVENKKIHCRPCTHIGLPKCPKGHFRCMNDIPLQEVLLAVDTLATSQQLHKQS